jgi:hypothetical protein
MPKNQQLVAPKKSASDTVLPHQFISNAVKRTGKTNQEIAEETGFSRGNVVAMISSGAMNVPINRVAAFARAIEVDPVALLRKVLSDSDSHLLDTIEEVMKMRAISEDEFEFISLLRKMSGNLEIAWAGRKELVDAMEPVVAKIKKADAHNAKMEIAQAHERDNRRPPLSKL